MSNFRTILTGWGLVFFLVILVPSRSYAQDGDEDRDIYKLSIAGDWWFSHPSGYFNGKDKEGYFDINRDFGFSNYSTFTGAVDWRFKRKHHLLFAATPLISSRSATLTRTIEFQGQTFDVGTSATAKVTSLAFGPGYQYDIIRRNRGYLAIAVQLELLDTTASLTANGSVNNQSASRSASGSFFAPLPVFGPRFRWYPLPHSSRFSIDGNVQGMYFFGYGDFVSSRATLNFGLTQHLRAHGGYQLGSRFSIHGTTDNIGIRLTQKGPIAGLEYRW